MDLETIGLILDTIGTIMIAIAALSVHHRFLHEHKVDRSVFGMMRVEQKAGFLGILFVLVGFVVQLFGT